MTYKNKCLKALNSEDFFIKSRDNQLYDLAVRINKYE